MKHIVNRSIVEQAANISGEVVLRASERAIRRMPGRVRMNIDSLSKDDLTEAAYLTKEHGVEYFGVYVPYPSDGMIADELATRAPAQPREDDHGHR